MSTIVSLIDNNKTKLLGAVTVVLGFIQGYPGLHDLLSTQVYAWVMFTIGALVTLCGFLNTAKAKAEAKVEVREEILSVRQAGFTRPLMLAVLLACSVPVVLGLSGCPATIAAYRAADTPSDYALVVLEHYDAVLIEAGKFKANPRIPPAVIEGIKAADLRAQPFVDSIRPLQLAYEASHSSADALALQKSVDDAIKAVADLVKAVKAAKVGVQ